MNRTLAPTSIVRLGLSAGLLAFLGANAWADQPDYSITQHVEAHHSFCGPSDPTCRDHFQTIETSNHFLALQAGAGVTFSGGTGQANAAVKFSAQGINTDYISGDLKAVMFDVMYVPQEHTGNALVPNAFRARFTLADTEVLFLCTDTESGNIVPPIPPLESGLGSSCKPGGAWAYVGAGGKLAEIQWDVATKRVAARWAEIHAVLNLLGNANSEDYLKARLQAYAGASLDTVFYGNTPGTHGGSSTAPRGNFGLTGMIRSRDMNWEIRGMAGFRPNLANLNDYSIEVRSQALYHVLLAEPTAATPLPAMLDLGVDAQYQYNTVPANSMGDFVSDRDRNSAYLGAVLGFSFQ